VVMRKTTPRSCNQTLNNTHSNGEADSCQRETVNQRDQCNHLKIGFNFLLFFNKHFPYRINTQCMSILTGTYFPSQYKVYYYYHNSSELYV